MRPRTGLIVVLLSVCWFQLGHGFGATTPSGPIYVLANGTLKITCTIDLRRTEGLNSSSLAWFNWQGPVEEKYVHTVDAATAQLIIPDVQPSTNSYICKLRKRDGSVSAISYNDVNVGYRPTHVENFQCRSHNWMNMTCTFTKSHNQVADSKYRLFFRVDKRDYTEYECTLQPMLESRWSCTLLLTDSKNGIYRQTYPYYFFKLTTESTLGSFSEEFQVNHYSSVIPGPPLNLNVTNISPNGVTLTWRAPLEMQSFPEKLIHSISYTSVYDHGVWHEMPAKITVSHKEQIRYDIVDLPYAYVAYDVRVRIRVHDAADKPEMWSRNATLIFTSGTRIPDAPPATDVGGFYVDDNDHVYVYWRELPKHDENGPQFQYVVRGSTQTGQQIPICTAFMAKYVNVGRNRFEDIHFDISSTNAIGASRNTSHVRVPRRDLRCPQPGEIRNILHNKNDPDRHYVFSWGRPTNATASTSVSHPAISSYTVFWCKARNESPNQCDGGFNFTRVSANTSSYTHATNDTLNFAVSANALHSSSGMSWARCTAIANNDINKVTDAKPTVGSDTATLEWNTACIDESLSHGYIITYCLVQGERDNSNCSEPPSNVTIDGAAIHSYKLPELIPYRTYKVNIAAKSADKIGPLSDPVYFTTLEASPSPPRSLMVLELNSSAATLQWDPPAQMNGVLNRYIVYFNSQKYDMPKSGSAGDRMVFVLTGLDANTDYRITIRACTGARLCSESSNTVAVHTDVGPPGAVRLLANGQPGEIGWQQPLQAGGNLDYYELEMEHDGGRRHRVLVNGTRCRIALAMCLAGEESYSFRVRAVNVMYAAHQTQLEQRQRRAMTTSTASTALEIASPTALYETAASPMAAVSTTVTSLLLGGLAHRICEEEDAGLVQRIKAHDPYATFYPGEWLVVKNQDCRTTNRTMFAVMMATLFGVMLVAYLFGSFAFRKLKRMKDIDVELPEGLQDIITEGGNGGCGGKGSGGGGLMGGGMSGGGVVLGGGLNGRVGGVLDMGRMSDPSAMLGAEKQLFVCGAEQEESLLPLATDRSLTHSELDDEERHSNGRSSHNSQCEDSDGGAHDGSSGRTLLMGSNIHMEKYMDFAGTSPMISKFTPPTFTPPTVLPVLSTMLGATGGSDSAYVPAPMLTMRPQHPPTPAASAAFNANGYVTHESLTSPPLAAIESSAPMPVQSPPAALTTASAPGLASAQQTPNINGYLPWNAITAAALSAAAADASAAYVNSASTNGTNAAAPPALPDDAASKDGGQKHAGAPLAASAASAGDRANAADSVAAAVTGISGYVTHKQLSDFGQLIQ